MSQPITVRRFLKMVVATAGGAGLAQVVGRAKPAEANYTPGSPSDTVDTNLTVQGNLVVNQNVGIGTSTPGGRLEVTGTVTNGDLVLIATDGRAKQSYYAAGPYVAPPTALSTGTWGRVRTASWNAALANTWNGLMGMDCSWDRLLGSYTWNQLLSMSWSDVTNL